MTSARLTGYGLFLDWYERLGVSQIAEVMHVIADAIGRSERQCWRYLATARDDGCLAVTRRFDTSKPKGHQAQLANDYIIRPSPWQRQQSQRHHRNAMAYRIKAKARNLVLRSNAILHFMQEQLTADLTKAAQALACREVSRFRPVHKTPPDMNVSPKAELYSEMPHSLNRKMALEVERAPDTQPLRVTDALLKTRIFTSRSDHRSRA